MRPSSLTWTLTGRTPARQSVARPPRGRRRQTTVERDAGSRVAHTSPLSEHTVAAGAAGGASAQAGAEAMAQARAASAPPPGLKR